MQVPEQLMYCELNFIFFLTFHPQFFFSALDTGQSQS